MPEHGLVDAKLPAREAAQRLADELEGAVALGFADQAGTGDGGAGWYKVSTDFKRESPGAAKLWPCQKQQSGGNLFGTVPIGGIPG